MITDWRIKYQPDVRPTPREFVALLGQYYDKKYWPDACDKCGAPAWIGAVHIQCSVACCRERR